MLIDLLHHFGKLLTWDKRNKKIIKESQILLRVKQSLSDACISFLSPVGYLTDVISTAQVPCPD